MKKRVLAVVLFLTTMVTCSFAFSNIAGPSSICQGETAKYTLMMPEGLDVTWEITGNARIVSPLGSTSIDVQFYGSGNVTIKATSMFNQVDTKTVRVKRAPQLTIRQVFEFFSDTKLTFVADPEPYSHGTYNWYCGNNNIEHVSNGKVNIDMLNPTTVTCYFYNGCGSAHAEIEPKFFLKPTLVKNKK
ncbi:MAG: hypothetical protein N4A72_08065 [Bacteroidales bacterium]|nr:hypothetical protein [Bacteroidales bacterium]